jgi:hypothetical protein
MSRGWGVSFLPPENNRYPVYRRLGGPQGRSEQVRNNLAHTGIRSPDRPVRSQSLYRLSYPAYNRFETCPLFSGSQDGNWGVGRRWSLQLCNFVRLTADRREERWRLVDRVLFQVVANCSLQPRPHWLTSAWLPSGVPVMTSDLHTFHLSTRHATPKVQVNVKEKDLCNPSILGTRFILVANYSNFP